MKRCATCSAPALRRGDRAQARWVVSQVHDMLERRGVFSAKRGGWRLKGMTLHGAVPGAPLARLQQSNSNLRCGVT
jgi:hypothetical protein